MRRVRWQSSDSPTLEERKSMAGAKVDGWFVYMNASENLAQAQIDHDNKKINDSELLMALTNGVQQHGAGARACFQELYERLERLHQKIDRIEAKIGSVPKK
jgi:hypothetical protein